MKQNKYDDNVFFQKYSQMDRSVKGLEGAGEWKTLERLLPDFHDKHVLDLGCGFGWHCRYAAEHGAASVLGVDISAKMIAKARSMGNEGIIEYRCMPMEDILLPEASFDIVLSSLAFPLHAGFPGSLPECLPLAQAGRRLYFLRGASRFHRPGNARLALR